MCFFRFIIIKEDLQRKIKYNMGCKEIQTKDVFLKFLKGSKQCMHAHHKFLCVATLLSICHPDIGSDHQKGSSLKCYNTNKLFENCPIFRNKTAFPYQELTMQRQCLRFIKIQCKYSYEFHSYPSIHHTKMLHAQSMFIKKAIKDRRSI